VIVYSTNFGLFWGQALNTEQVQRVRSDWHRAGSDVELSFRNLTGVRPTPSRWRLWMGQRFLASNSDYGYGVCTYPGLLMRSVSKIHAWVRDPVDSSGVRSYGDLFYAWRDGFLIASLDSDYVRASLSSEPILMQTDVPPEAVVIETRVAPIVSIEIRATDEFPITGRIASTVRPRSAPMTLPNAWRTPPMAACSATAWQDIASLLAIADEGLSRSDRWENIRSTGNELFSTWELSTPPLAWEDDRLDHCSLVLHDFDITSNVPYPELALIIRSTLPAAGTHPLETLLPSDIEAIPYEWGGFPGMLYPMVGAQWAPCLGHMGRDWIGASRERVMRAITEDLGDGSPVEADFTVQIDWQQVSNALGKMVMQVEDMELFPEMNRDEVRATMVPIARALRHLGRTEILGKNIDGTNVIKGRLARRAPEYSQ